MTIEINPLTKAERLIIRKTHTDRNSDGKSFVLSDETPDRMGDVIMADGWSLEAFRKNPIALFSHRGDFPLGTWNNLRVEQRRLVGDLTLAPKGTSDRIDEMTRLIDAGILRATSVGFRPLEKKPRKVNDQYVGDLYVKQDLVEVSMVAVPANPNALAIAKELKISDDVRSLVFAEHGAKSEPVKHIDHIGEYAKLREPDRWSPEQAAQAKKWLMHWQQTYPDSWLYRKMYRLMDEIETVRTVVAEHGKKRSP